MDRNTIHEVLRFFDCNGLPARYDSNWDAVLVVYYDDIEEGLEVGAVRSYDEALDLY